MRRALALRGLSAYSSRILPPQRMGGREHTGSAGSDATHRLGVLGLVQVDSQHLPDNVLAVHPGHHLLRYAAEGRTAEPNWELRAASAVRPAHVCRLASSTLPSPIRLNKEPMRP